MDFFRPIISKRLNKFFNDNHKTISFIFSILKSIKKNAVDAYYYSEKNPPQHPRYKYTDKLYIGCIFYILKHGTTWDSFIGPIDGKLLNKRHHDYLKMDIYSKFYNECLQKYLETHDVKYLSIDSTTLNNKYCIEAGKNNPINKSRKGLKISVIVDDKGAPIEFLIKESTINDSKIAMEDIDNLTNNKIITNALEKTKGYPYLLGDSGYDSSFLREKLKKNSIRSVFYPRNRNCKNKKLKRYLNKEQIKIYKKRLVVEHFFAIIKKHAKINCIYEKTIYSFNGLVLFLFGSILLKRS